MPTVIKQTSTTTFLRWCEPDQVLRIYSQPEGFSDTPSVRHDLNIGLRLMHSCQQNLSIDYLTVCLWTAIAMAGYILQQFSSVSISDVAST